MFSSSSSFTASFFLSLAPFFFLRFVFFASRGFLGRWSGASVSECHGEVHWLPWSVVLQSRRVPTKLFPRHVRFSDRRPPLVSFQTIPSRLMAVPGSHAPRLSGSVRVPTS